MGGGDFLSVGLTARPEGLLSFAEVRVDERRERRGGVDLVISLPIEERPSFALKNLVIMLWLALNI